MKNIFMKFCYYEIMKFCNIEIMEFCYSGILLFWDSVILLYCIKNPKKPIRFFSVFNGLFSVFIFYEKLKIIQHQVVSTSTSIIINYNNILEI